MTNLYIKSLHTLLNELHAARKSPYNNIQKWFYLQLKLLKKIKYIEGRIRESKKNIIQLKKDLNTPMRFTSKTESTKAKTQIDLKSKRINEYGFLLLCFKSIADGIAFTFIDKYDIKPQNFKESPGFITGKEGLRMELKNFKYFFKSGMIAILNDLTSVLKYNDITILTPNGFVAIEVKSSLVDSPRIQRQRIKSNSLLNYLHTDETNELYGQKGNFIRRSLDSPEKNFSEKFNRIIKKSREIGLAHQLLEPGLVYFVCHYTNEIDKVLDGIKERYKLQKPIFHLLNSNQLNGLGYYPHSLSLKTQNYLELLNGNCFGLIIFDLVRAEHIAKEKGYTVQFDNSKDWALEFYSTEGEMVTAMSYHLFGRIFNEFISAKQIIEAGFILYDQMLKEFDNSSESPPPSL